ncbi:MAG: threonylcarbamoyl-AMP synthase [Candidatus Omnitrophica bacterium]|nr:threonylcarbamoyl-AMP synthase [Candidatus Omnitrophota bacterium]
MADPAAAPRRLRVTGGEADAPMLREAARILCAGGLVAFPTETVYGLGADATNPAAIERLNRVKGRPPDKPYSWHVHSVSQVEAQVGALPPGALRLIERFWPGPLTLILPAARGGAIGFRLPDHPVAQAFLAACGVPVAAPSANRSGQPPPRDAQAVVAGLDGAFDCLLDGGPARLGRESTVVQVTPAGLQVLREGAIPTAEIMAIA